MTCISYIIFPFKSTSTSSIFFVIAYRDGIGYLGSNSFTNEQKVESSTKLIGALVAAKNIDSFFVIALYLGSPLLYDFGLNKFVSFVWLPSAVKLQAALALRNDFFSFSSS